MFGFSHYILQFFRLITSMPVHTQRLLVLLFGTFRVIASNADRAGTGMTSEALGVSVAPSFFQSCVSDGKTAKMEDVLRYKVSNPSSSLKPTLTCFTCSFGCFLKVCKFMKLHTTVLSNQICCMIMVYVNVNFLNTCKLKDWLLVLLPN